MSGRTKKKPEYNSKVQFNNVLQERVRLLKEIPSEENLWQAVIAFQDYPFKTVTGLPFRYKLKVGKNGEYTIKVGICSDANKK